MDLGKEIRDMRLLKGLTPIELAIKMCGDEEKARNKVSTIYCWERHDRYPRIKEFTKCMNAMDVEVIFETNDGAVSSTDIKDFCSKVRNYLGLTQAELSEKMGKNNDYINHFEISKFYPNYDTALELLDALDAKITLKPKKTITAYDENGNFADLDEWKAKIRADAIKEVFEGIYEHFEKHHIEVFGKDEVLDELILFLDEYYVYHKIKEKLKEKKK